MESKSMIVCRSCALIRRAIPYSPQRKAASASPRDSNFFHSGDSEGDSTVYRNALLFQRPAFVEPRQPLLNSVSFIGTVKFHPRTISLRNSQFGVYTALNVETPAHSSRKFSFLSSYEKDEADGKPRLYYKVVVKELNYVSPCTRGQPQSVKSESQGGIYGLGKKEERLHLWQIYFASPHEWWDNRKKKKFPGAPDFRHKDTGESLWLKSDDPPWVRKQLQLLDSRMPPVAGTHIIRGRVSPWVFDG